MNTGSNCECPPTHEFISINIGENFLEICNNLEKYFLFHSFKNTVYNTYNIQNMLIRLFMLVVRLLVSCRQVWRESHKLYTDFSTAWRRRGVWGEVSAPKPGIVEGSMQGFFHVFSGMVGFFGGGHVY